MTTDRKLLLVLTPLLCCAMGWILMKSVSDVPLASDTAVSIAHDVVSASTPAENRTEFRGGDSFSYNLGNDERSEDRASFDSGSTETETDQQAPEFNAFDAMLLLETEILKLPPYDGTERGFEMKYQSFNDRQLNLAYSIVDDEFKRDAKPIVMKMIDQGRYSTQPPARFQPIESMLGANTPEELQGALVATPQQAFPFSATWIQSDIQGDEVAQKWVDFPWDEYPSAYQRKLEAWWLHSRLVDRNACRIHNHVHSD